MANVTLSPRDIDYIARVVETEVPRSIQQRDPETYNRMVSAVVDTITNRVASPSFPNTVEAVVNQDRQFSKIAGPTSYRDRQGRLHNLNPYGSVSKAPQPSRDVLSLVQNHVTQRAYGAPSVVGGALHYANPNASSKNNLGWISRLTGPKLGVGSMMHVHGTAPGYQPAPEYQIAIDGMHAAPVPTPAPSQTFAAPAGTIERGLLQPPQMAFAAPVGPVQRSPLQPLAPALPQPQTLLDYPINAPVAEPQTAQQQAPQQQPSMPSASEIYGGLLGTGMANNGNLVSRDAYDRTYVTNQYGVTTATMPDGSQAGVLGGMPSLQGPVGGMIQPQDPTQGFLGIPEAQSRFGQTVRGGLGGAAGGLLGGLLGPAGAVLGGLLGRELANGRNPLDAFSRQTNAFARPDYSLNQYPIAPTGGSRSIGSKGGPSYGEMASISPGAAEAISSGYAGLY